MKYSLKNRQFRKKNTIFGQRRPEETLPQQIRRDLEAIYENKSQSEESKTITIHEPKNERVSKIFQFINFEEDAAQHRRSSEKKEIRRNSDNNRRSRQELSPTRKPFLQFPQIRLAESVQSVQFSKNFEVQSQTVSFCFRPEQKPNNSKQINQFCKKLYGLFFKNNERIDKMQALVMSIVKQSKHTIEGLIQGLSTAKKMQEQTSILFNTMRSVYQNLRVCKLKQQNLQLYFDQDQGQKLHQLQNILNSRTVKYEKPKYSLSNRHFESNVTQKTEKDKESRDLALLVDYESEPSLVEAPYVENTLENESRSANRNHDFQFHRLLAPLQLDNDPIPPQCNQYQQLSPFQANRMMSNHYTESTEVNISPQFIRSQQISAHSHNYQTFRPAKTQPQSESQRIKAWLRSSNQMGLKCWMDELGCLRRCNNTYIFNGKGEVLTVCASTFAKLIQERWFLPVVDKH